VVIIGAGAGGLAMAIALKKAGLNSFTIFEKSAGVGGTWRDNTYPGAQCDIMSHMYSYSFERKADWSRLYARQPEILAYLEHCADKYGLRPHLRCRSPIHEARWDDSALVWRLKTGDGEAIEADIVVSGLGMLNVPSYPDISGLDGFAGPVFHSARWDPQVDLDGRQVAVIGTGASAIQLVPEIAPGVERLLVFQRTAQWVMPSVDRPYTDAEVWRFRHVPLAGWVHRIKIFCRYERLTSFHLSDPQRVEYTKLARANLDGAVADADRRAALLPDYPIGCKRLIRSATWYPTLCRSNVEVVSDKIIGVTPTGITTAD
jgi:cation diffusion facilitator CzcD-associated flavoprotein CzcO